MTKALKTSTSKGASLNIRPSLMALDAVEVSNDIGEKVVLLGDVRQKLAMARDLMDAGEGQAEEASKVSSDAATRLYQARIAGVIQPDEVTGVLGDIFGFKAKKDGTPSKTPNKHGEAIRKRVVRAVNAAEFATSDGKSGGAFFEGMPLDASAEIDGETVTVSTVLNRLDNGDTSIWTAYDQIGKIKAGTRQTVNIAFDPKRISGLAETVSEEAAARHFLESKPLRIAYRKLLESIGFMDERAALMAEAGPDGEGGEAPEGDTQPNEGEAEANEMPQEQAA
jgi:hypothetical protein